MTRPSGPLSSPLLSHILELAGDGDQPKSSWIQVAAVGFWKGHPKLPSGFGLTKADLAQMVVNFDTVTPIPPTKLPVDYNHGTSNPKNAEAGKAAGWITDLELRANGDELWAHVEWTPPAAEMIAAKEYQYVSATFAFDYEHTSGKNIGTTLLAAAATNRPFIEGMAPMQLSHLFERVSPPQEIDMKVITVKDATGKEITLTADQVAAIVKEHAPAPSGDVELSKKVVDLSAAVETMKTGAAAQDAKIVELTKANAALELARKTADATAKVTRLIEAGKALPVEKEGLIALALSDDALFENATKHRPVIVELGREHGTGAGGDATANGQIEAAITEELKADPKISRERAMTLALAKNPKLYELTTRQ